MNPENPVKVTTNPETGERFYTLDGVDYISVTTALSKGVNKGGIAEWKEKLYRTKAIEYHYDLGEALASDGADGATAKLKEYVEEEAGKGRSLGSQVHNFIEAELKTGLELHAPKAIKGYIDSFHRFLDDHQPEFVIIENAMFNTELGYAGRTDVGFKTEKYGLSLGDWKTTRAGRHGHGIYPETALQLNAYDQCQLMVDDEGNRLDVPDFDTLLGINLRPRSYKVVPVEKSAKCFKYFRAMLKSAEWANGAGFAFLGRSVEG